MKAFGLYLAVFALVNWGIMPGADIQAPSGWTGHAGYLAQNEKHPAMEDGATVPEQGRKTKVDEVKKEADNSQKDGSDVHESTNPVVPPFMGTEPPRPDDGNQGGSFKSVPESPFETKEGD